MTDVIVFKTASCGKTESVLNIRDLERAIGMPCWQVVRRQQRREARAIRRLGLAEKMSDPTAVDWTDPCARATALRAAYYTLLIGGQEAEIRTRSLDADEMVRFQPGNLDSLRSEMTAAEADCAAKTAATAGPTLPKRFAIACRAKRHGRGHPFFRGFE